MSIAFKTLSCMLLFAQVAQADIQVSCSNKKNTVAWQYIIKSTPSNRLASDILFTLNGAPTILSTSRVAQHVASNQGLYLLVDDSAEQITHRFSTEKVTRTTFEGKLEIFTTPASTTKVTCKATTI